jgi:GTPase SAR1 family protein
MAALFDWYSESKRFLQAHFKELNEICARRGNEKLRALCSEAGEKLEADAFYLVVLGQFKRGKSTLINSLLGEPILPTGMIPLTSMVTLLRYGEEPGAEIWFENGDKRPIPLDDLPQFVTEKGNPGNAKGVRQAEIRYPSPLLERGLVLVDTPGVGSTYLGNTEMTYAFLPRADAAAFVFSVDPPISQAETEFLKQARRHVAKMFFLLNKIDYVAPGERQEVLEFNRGVLKEILPGQALHLQPLSAKWALEAKREGNESRLRKSLLPEFESRLESFLMQEKGQLLVSSAVRKAQEVLGEIELSLELENKALTLPMTSLLERIRDLKELMARVQQDHRDLEYLLKGEGDRKASEFIQRLTVFQEAEAVEVAKRLKAWLRENAGLNPGVLLRNGERKLLELISESFTRFLGGEEERLNRELQEVAARLGGRANQRVREITALAKSLFDVRLVRLDTFSGLTEPSKVWFKTAEPFSPATTTLLSLLPKTLGRLTAKRIENSLLERVPEEMDRNSGRVRHDTLRRLDETLRLFGASLFKKIETVSETVLSGLSKGQEKRRQGQAEVDQELAALNREREALQALRAEFEKVSEALVA